MKNNFHEDRLVGLLLTFLGGMIDYYTYVHYKTFASAQTGNLIIAISQLRDHQWDFAIKKILSITFFFSGVFVARVLIDFCRKKKVYYWRIFILYFEALIFFVTSLKISQPYQTTIIIFISLISAIRWVSFDRINGLTYTNLFTTGNIKGLSTNLYCYLRSKDDNSKNKLLHFFLVVISFTTGIISSLFLYEIIFTNTVLVISSVFLCLAIFETFYIGCFYKKGKFKY
jgi:uncharacterized membrane protein YoaK (UPF0700 family)